MTTLSLNDSELLRQQAYIAGRWCEADNRKSFVVTNPASGEVLAQVPAMEAAETRRAIEAAKGAWLKWRWKTAKERAALLRKWSDLMMANVDDLARIYDGRTWQAACRIQRRNHQLLFTLKEDRVYIIAVKHDRRAPDYWRHRIS